MPLVRPPGKRVLIPYLAAAWVAVLVLGITNLVLDDQETRYHDAGASGALPSLWLMRLGGGLVALLAGALVWFTASEPIRLRARVDEATGALAKSERRFRELYEHAPLAYVTLDADARITRANQRAHEVFEAPAGTLVGRRILEMFPDGARGRDMAELVLARATQGEAARPGDIQGEELTMTTGGGSRIWVNFAVRPNLADDDPNARNLSMILDITERKRAEEKLGQYARELEASNRDLEQFAYVASHDLQEPLRLIHSYVALVERRYGDKLDQDARDFLAFAREAAGRQQEMVQGLLQYARVGTRGRDLEPTRVEDALAEVRRDLGVSIAETDAEITAAELPVVSADPQQLRQVLQNLLGNAIKYRSDEHPRIHVSAQRDRDRWRISVADNGIGIDPQESDRLFQVFSRLHRDDGREGTGIGLAVCKRIVERHGGRIWVEPNLDPAFGRGSVFHFTMAGADGAARELLDGWSGAEPAAHA